MRFGGGLLAALLLVGTEAAPLTAATPPKGGSVSLETRLGEGSDEVATRTFSDAAAAALAAKGFVILNDPGHAAYVAVLVLSRADVGTGLAKASQRGTVTGAGAGVVVPLATGASRVAPLRRFRLDLRIRRQGDPATVWHGAAVTVRAGGTARGDDQTVATDLAEALLRAYPAEPEEAVGVP